MDLPVSSTTTLAEQLSRSNAPSFAAQSTEQMCREQATKIMHPDTLPPTRSFELYLIRALSYVPSSNGKNLAVIYPPEFLFVLDVGLDSLVGVCVTWVSTGYGDPEFPDFSKTIIRSVPSRDSGRLIFPNVVGEILIGIKEGTSEAEARRGLEEAGLSDIKFFDFFATALSKPFDERATCRRLESGLPFVKYAQPNNVIRLVDFNPGWHVMRMM